MIEGLLAVQDHDTAIDQLRHRIATLPARAELQLVEEQLVALEAEAAELGEQVGVIERRQKAAEDEVASLGAKIAELDAKLYSGTVTSPKELQAIQADIDSIRRHQSDVEDGILEAMEEREPFDARQAELDANRTQLDATAMHLRATIAQAETEIEAELATETDARTAAASAVPAALLDEYERLRPKLGGVAAARLEPGGRCGGCHLTLPATEVARIKREPPDALIHCDQCGRILVRVDQ